jgi:hypothetical protein
MTGFTSINKLINLQCLKYLRSKCTVYKTTASRTTETNFNQLYFHFKTLAYCENGFKEFYTKFDEIKTAITLENVNIRR